MMEKRGWIELDESPDGKWVASGYIVRDDPSDSMNPEIIVQSPYPDDCLSEAASLLWGCLPTRGDV